MKMQDEDILCEMKQLAKSDLEKLICDIPDEHWQPIALVRNPDIGFEFLKTFTKYRGTDKDFDKYLMAMHRDSPTVGYDAFADKLLTDRNNINPDVEPGSKIHESTFRDLISKENLEMYLDPDIFKYIDKYPELHWQMNLLIINKYISTDFIKKHPMQNYYGVNFYNVSKIIFSKKSKL